MNDTMQIEILADGTIKTTTDPISDANHQSAEQFLRDVQKLTGGQVTRSARESHAQHHHHHHAKA